MVNYFYPKCCKEPKWTRRARYSITPWPLAKKMAYTIHQNFGNEYHNVIDMTACYGNESMACAKYFSKIFSCEWEPTHFKELQKSTKQFKLKYPHTADIQLLAQDSLKFLEQYINNHPGEKVVVLCDPPWPGGKKYMEKRIIGHEIFLISGKRVFDFTILYPECAWIIKIPKNFDILNLVSFLSKNKNTKMKIWPQICDNNLIFYYVFVWSVNEKK